MNMKSFLKLGIIGIIGFLIQSCAEPELTFEEKLENCLSAYFEVDSVDSYSVLDTVYIENLDSAQLLYEESNVIMEIDKKEIQNRIDTAEIRLTESKKVLDEMTFDMLIPFAEETVASWESTLLIEKAGLNRADSMITVANKELSFIDEARKSVVENKAFYTVLTKVKGEEKLLFVTPKFKVIRED